MYLCENKRGNHMAPFAYYKNYFDKPKYSVVNYLLKNDKDGIIERIRGKVSQRLTDKEKLLKFYV